MKDKTLEIIKREIQNSPNLSGMDKLEALILLDTASKAIPMREAVEMVHILTDLYDDVTGEDYKEVLLEVIKEYKTRIRVLSYKFPEESSNVYDLLKSLGIPTDGIPQETLDLKLTVGIDDGMGYAASGFQDVIDTYPDLENGVLRIWA